MVVVGACATSAGASCFVTELFPEVFSSFSLFSTLSVSSQLSSLAQDNNHRSKDFPNRHIRLTFSVFVRCQSRCHRMKEHLQRLRAV